MHCYNRMASALYLFYEGVSTYHFEQLIRHHASTTQTKPAHHLYAFYYRLPIDCNCLRKTKINFGALDISQH